MDDLISRQAAIDALNEVYCHIEMVKKRPVNKTEQAVYLDMIGAVKSVPSEEPEIKPIEYRDCADAMLKMWMDNVVTDGEYNRIVDKLNAHWRMENGRSGQ